MPYKADRPVTFMAAAAISARNRFVVVTADQTVGLAGAGARADGVNLDTAGAAGDEVPVATEQSGPSVLIEAGAAFAAGAMLMPDANGRAVTATGAGPYSAKAWSAATALGDLVECQLRSGVA